MQVETRDADSGGDPESRKPANLPFNDCPGQSLISY